MRVQCPKCGVGGNIPDEKIPSDGRNLVCPKCKKSFFVNKKLVAATSVPIDFDVAVTYQEGVRLLKEKQIDAAIEKLGAVIQHEPEYGAAYRYIGLAYGQKNLWEEVITVLQKAVSLKPDDVLSLKNLGIAYLRQERYSEATSVLQQALQHAPDDEKAQSFLQMALQRQQQQQTQQAAVDDEPEAFSPDNFLSESADASTSKKSRTEKITAEVPHNPIQEFLDKGTEFLDNGQHNKAIEMFEEAIRLVPESSDGYFGLGMVYEKLQERKKAIAAYQKAVNANPDDSLAKENLKYLKKQKKTFTLPWKK